MIAVACCAGLAPLDTNFSVWFLFKKFYKTLQKHTRANVGKWERVYRPVRFIENIYKVKILYDTELDIITIKFYSAIDSKFQLLITICNLHRILIFLRFLRTTCKVKRNDYPNNPIYFNCWLRCLVKIALDIQIWNNIPNFYSYLKWHLRNNVACLQI